jgi:hypothetical protein
MPLPVDDVEHQCQVLCDLCPPCVAVAPRRRERGTAHDRREPPCPSCACSPACARKMASQSARASRTRPADSQKPDQGGQQGGQKGSRPRGGWLVHGQKSPVSAGLFIFALSMKKHLLHCPPGGAYSLSIGLKGTLLHCTCLYLSEKSKGPNENRAGRSPY